METSDSECFESADEEFYSDNEEETARAAPTAQKCVPPNVAELENLTIKDVKIANTAQVQPRGNNSSDDNNPVSENACDASPAVATSKEPTNKPEKRDRHPRARLGVKLGTKIKKSDLNLPENDLEGTSKEISDSEKNDEQYENYLENPRENQSKGLSKSNVSNLEKHTSTVKDVENSKFVIPPTMDDSGHAKCTTNGNTLDVEKSVDKRCAFPQEEENMWENDDWEPMSNTDNAVNEKDHYKNGNDREVNSSQLKTDDPDSGWIGWGNWGVSSLLSTATVGVTTITNHVSQGLTTVLESGIGVPEPEELARLHKEEKEKGLEADQLEHKGALPSNLSFGLGNFVSGVTHITKLVESTGTKVISGGLDTLETIGKKTMEVLQEGDPGLKKKRAFLKIESHKPVLSHMLREAKEKAENENKLLEEKRFSKKANYETLFDDHQGLVHLEALEMLSRQCDIKLQTQLESQSGGDLIEMQETMSQVNELCELTEEEEEETLDISDVKEKLNSAVSEMNVPIAYDKLISTWVDTEEWLQNINLNICDELELHEQAIDTLAQLTAIAVEQFHKIGELLLVKEHRSTADEADSLVQLTTVLTALIGNVATKLASKLNEKASNSPNKQRVSSLITNVYFEAANSSSYIKNAFQLLIPVLQVGAV